MKKYVLPDVPGVIFTDVDTEVYTEAVEVTPEQAAGIEDGTHYYDTVEKAVKEVPPYVPTLDDIKNAKIADIQQAAYNATADGITVIVDDVTYTLAASESDQKIFGNDGSGLSLAMQVDDYEPGEPVLFLDIHGVPHTLPVEKYALLLSKYRRGIRSIWEQRATLIYQVGQCATAEQVEAIEVNISEVSG